MNLIWDIYEIKSDEHALHGVSLRRRIRTFSIEKEITCLSENANDKKNVVRFALLSDTEGAEIIEFIQSMFPGVTISQVMKAIENPTLSKMKINDHSR